MRRKWNHVEKMDERQKELQEKANGVGMIFLGLCLAAAMIYRMATEGELGWEFLAITACLPVVRLARRLYGDAEVPRDFKNYPLPTGSSGKERRVRCRSYAIDALLFSLPIVVIGAIWLLADPEDGGFYQFVRGLFPALNRGPLILVATLVIFAIFFATSFITRYLYTELFLVKQYNRMLNEMDEEA